MNTTNNQRDKSCVLRTNLMEEEIKNDDGFKYLRANLTENKYIPILTKAFYFNSNGDYLSAIIYGTLCLWMYQIQSNGQGNAGIISSLTELIEKSKLSYKKQLQKQSEQGEDSDTPKFKIANTRDLTNETGDPLRFDKIVGMRSEKDAVLSKFIYPNRFPFLFPKEKNNMLFYGPPGTGKTYLAKSSAVEFDSLYRDLKVFFISSSASELRSKWEGGTEKNIAELFTYAQKLANDYVSGSSIEGVEATNRREKCKVIIFLDEVEILAADRTKSPENSRSVTTLLQQMDGFSSGDRKDVMVLAATNLPWNLDDAFLRRFSAKILIDLPDYSARVILIVKSIIDKFKKYPVEMKFRLCNAKFVGISDRNTNNKQVKDFDEYYNTFYNMYSEFTIKTYFSQYFNEYKEYEKTLSEEEQKVYRSYVKDLDSNKRQIIINELQFLNTYFISSKIDRNTYNSYNESYNDLIKNIRDRDDFEDINMSNVFNQYIKFMTIEYFDVQEPSEDLLKLVSYINYLSEVTGPCPMAKIYNLNALFQNKTSKYALSSFGYSNSDLTELINEFYGLMASNIIKSGFVEQRGRDKVICDTLCRCGGNVPQSGVCGKCWKKSEGTEVNEVKYINQENAASNMFLDENDNDIYVSFNEEFFVSALRNFATTTGKNTVMCNLWEYSSTSREPNSEKMCDELMRKWELVDYK